MKNYTSSQISALSRLFSSSVVRELARSGKSPLFARLAHEVLAHPAKLSARRVYNFFDAAFDVLKQTEHRHEYIYKAALTQNILLGKHKLHTASMLTEFRVGACKADVAILNGTATVYEIKSERDSLSRLDKQVEAYCNFFAKVYVIAGENHLNAIHELVSSDVGIMQLTTRQTIRTVREAKDRPERTSPITILESIRTEEAKRILLAMGKAVPDVPNTEMHAALRERFTNLPSRGTHEAMVKVLKQTRNLLPLSNLVRHLPGSLQNAALCIPLRKIDHDRLVGAMHTPLKDALEWA